MVDRLINALRPFTKTEFNQLIFFVTSKCNLKCRNCFNWKNLNVNKDLTLEEIEKISKSLPPFKVLLISGGEPFLRHDLHKLVEIFRKNNGIVFAGIPTNGTIGEKEKQMIKELLLIDKKLTISLYFSIDGLAKFHDWSRGIRGSFFKTISLIKDLSKNKKDYPNLSININTVISSENIKQIPLLTNYVENNLKSKIEGHYFEIVRGDARNPSVKEVTKDQLKEIYKFILNYQKRIYLYRKGGKFFNSLLSLIANTTVHFLYKTQFENFFNNKKWSMKCVAGKGIIVLGSQGELSVCELKKPTMNARNIDYDLNKYMNSTAMMKEIKEIERIKCSCTHGCFISESMYKSLSVVYWKLPLTLFNKIVRPGQF